MVTTIQLDEHVKEQLASVARQLEKELKKKVTYNDVVMYLLEISQIKPDKEKFNSLRGIISFNSAKESLQELRNLNKKRETKFERRSSS
ncbi:MAG: hypothetical protein ACTSRG_27345 [Candidatus Helarchaeota archaeon]